MSKWPTLGVFLWLVSANASWSLTQLGWLGVGDPVPQSDASSLSLGTYGLIHPGARALSVTLGLSSVTEAVSTSQGTDDRIRGYPHPPSLQLILPLSSSLTFSLGTRQLFDYNYDRESPIYDDLRQDLVIGVESVSSRGCLYALILGLTGNVAGALSLGADVLLSMGRQWTEYQTRFHDPALWGDRAREKEELQGVGVQVHGRTVLTESNELAVSYLSPQDVGGVHYPSAISLEFLHKLMRPSGPSLLLSLQRKDWDRTRGGFCNTLAVSLGSEFWVKGGKPLRLSLSSEPWYGAEPIEGVSLGVGTGVWVSRIWFDLGLKVGSRNFRADDEEVSEVSLRTLVTGSYRF